MTKKLYKLMNWARIEGIVYSDEDNPHEFLGLTKIPPIGALFQAFFPDVKKVYVCVKTGRDVKEYPMELADDAGFYAALVTTITGADKINYYYRVVDKKGVITEVEDPYRFKCTIDKKVLESFNAGLCYNIYDYLGAHVRKIDRVDGVSFAVWAPNAVRVSVVGDFNKWDGRVHQMRKLDNSGIFEIFIPDVKPDDNYKYEIKLRGDRIILKADPYAFYSELRPNTASTVYNIDGIKFDDTDYMENRHGKLDTDMPVSIYEVNLGLFKDDDGGFLNYKDIAEKLAKYVKEMGYTHVELLPVMEHPLDESLGFETIGYYSVTSRYGTPDDFAYFVNLMHKNDIGVIIDMNFAYFPKDSHGLSAFDGTCLYEHADFKQGHHPYLNTLLFNYGRAEVICYLTSSVMFYINKYHADAVKLNSLASMLYLDYGKESGQWVPNIYGGNENLEAKALIQRISNINDKLETGAVIMADGSTLYPGMTENTDKDGLGFKYKFNTLWISDVTNFLNMDPYFRADMYNEITFMTNYAYSENYILPVSHDEICGHGTMISKMSGDSDVKLANLRLLYSFMFVYPGKKLIYMGEDMALENEINISASIDFTVLENEPNRNFNNLIKELLSFYKKHPALYENDSTSDGFEWINNISAAENIMSFLRISDTEKLLVIANFANRQYDKYKVGVPYSGKFKEIFNSDDILFCGGGIVNKRAKQSKAEKTDGRHNSITVNIAPLSVSIFSCEKS